MASIYFVPLRDGPQTLSIALSGVVYQVRVRYSARVDLWVLDIADADGNSLVRDIPMVTGCDLLAQYHHLGFGGALIVRNVSTGTDDPPQFDELVGALLYVTGVEL